MHAADIMTTRVVSADPDTPVTEIAKMLLENRISAVPVLDGDRRVLGIVSEGDLMRRSESETEARHSWWLEAFVSKQEKAAEYIKTHGRKAKEVMSKSVVTAREDTPLQDVARLLETHHIKRIPIVRDGRLVGIISRANLLHGLVASGDKAGPTTPPGDRAIRETLTHTLGEEVGLNTAMLNVIVAEGVVTLWGIVDSEAERQAAQIAAEQTPGVKSVENCLKQLPSAAWAYI